MAIFADNYDSEYKYSVEDLCMHNELLYTCIKATEGGPWNDSNWAKTNVVLYKESESQDKLTGMPASYYKTWADPTGVCTAEAENVLVGKTAYSKFQKITGTMPNLGQIIRAIDRQYGTYEIPAGYTTGGVITAAVATEEKVVTTGGTVLPSEGYLLSKVEVNIEDYAGEVE